jgi:hypothetical protein
MPLKYKQYRKDRCRFKLAYPKEYDAWRAIQRRCTNPKDNMYPHYGGRGIKRCARWDSFKNFIFDMGSCPEGFTLERMENDGDYEPTNCCWASEDDQAKNRSNNRRLTLNGRTMILADWARELGIKQVTISARLRRDLPIEKVLARSLRP